MGLSQYLLSSSFSTQPTHLNNTLETVQYFDWKMPLKGWPILLFWIQSSIAHSSNFGPADGLFFKASGLATSPLVHFSQHSGQDQKKHQTIDIVSRMTLSSSQSHHYHHAHHVGLGESVCGLHNPQWDWSVRQLPQSWWTLHQRTKSGNGPKNKHFFSLNRCKSWRVELAWWMN